VAPTLLAKWSEAEALELFGRVLDAVSSCVGERLGLDGQLSNWALVDDELWYLDVTTPMMRDESGRELLDLRLFLAALPLPLRWPVKVILLPSILSHYYDVRSIVLDLLGNLYKEGLADHVPALMSHANRKLAIDPITQDEIRRYYRDDARTWELLLRLRRIDRWVQRVLLRRTYPFLLPGEIDRRV
jgi:hypothetical protein